MKLHHLSGRENVETVVQQDTTKRTGTKDIIYTRRPFISLVAIVVELSLSLSYVSSACEHVYVGGCIGKYATTTLSKIIYQLTPSLGLHIASNTASVLSSALAVTASKP